MEPRPNESTATAGVPLAVHWLGRIGYRDAWDLQKRLAAARAADRIGDQLLLLEHPAVLTMGRGADESHVLAPPALLEARGIELLRIERGGEVTYHGPGQLVAYPIVRLADRGLLLRPFVQALEAARSRGYHVAVDTSGFASERTILRVAEATDLFLYDLKVMDPERHEAFTGVALAPILRNLRALDRRGATVWVRLPLVPGHNDDPENLDAVGRFVAGLRRTRRVHVLPYHRLASAKYERLGLVNPLVEIPSPATADIDRAVAVLASYGLDVHVGG